MDRDNSRQNNQVDRFLQGISDRLDSLKLDLTSVINADTWRYLKEKYQQPSQDLMREYLTPIYPKSPKAGTPIECHAFNNMHQLIEILSILEELKSNRVELFEYIVKQATVALTERLGSYSLFKLAELLDIENFNPDRMHRWFVTYQLDQMATGKYQEADYLREIASLLVERNDLHTAYRLTARAIELRPQGPGIIRLHQQIEQKLGTSLNGK